MKTKEKTIRKVSEADINKMSEANKNLAELMEWCGKKGFTTFEMKELFHQASDFLIISIVSEIIELRKNDIL